MQTEEAIAVVPLFRNLTPEQRTKIAVYLKPQKYQAGDTIVHQNTPGDAMYIIADGKVKVSVRLEEAETIITFLTGGEFFGELAVLEGGKRSADVIAMESTKVYMLPAEDFLQCMMQMPEITLALLKELSARLRRSTLWIQTLARQDIYGRIAQKLLQLADMHGVPSGEGRLIPMRLTQNDIAGFVGASRESVNKVMGYFRNKGFISVDSSSLYITVHNPAALYKRIA